MPLPLLFFGNLLFGLSGTKALKYLSIYFSRSHCIYFYDFLLTSLPMFTALRRFSILLTMYGEFLILKSSKPCKIQLSVYIMVIGSCVAAYDDFSFNIFGYTSIILNDIFTAANNIYTKKKLEVLVRV